MENMKPFADRLVEMVEKKANGEKVNPFFRETGSED